MKRMACLVAATFFAATSFAQQSQMTDGNHPTLLTTMTSSNNLMYDMAGSPMKVKKKTDVIGDPYFNPDFCEATFYATSGAVYRGVRSKFNLQTNTLSFIRGDKEDEEYTPAFHVSKIAFTGCTDADVATVFRNGFPATGYQNENTFYQVLDSGKAMLLKYTSVVESRNTVNGFSSNSTSTVLDRAEVFYVYAPGKGMVKVSPKSTDDVLKALDDKRAQVDAYVKTNSIKIRKADDLKKVVQYYNTL